MALVSHKQRFIYLKTHKTGGTSMELALERFCAPPGHVPQRQTETRVFDEGIIASRFPLNYSDTTGWKNHMTAAAVRDLLGPETFASYVRVAMIRNPFNKAVSWFWHDHRDHTVMPEGQAAIDAFRAFIARKDANGHWRGPRDWDWPVCHIDGKRVIDLFVPLERLTETIPTVERRIGVSPGSLKVGHLNAGARKRDGGVPVSAYYDEATADILRRHWDWIFEAGAYSTDYHDADQPSGPERRKKHA